MVYQKKKCTKKKVYKKNVQKSVQSNTSTLYVETERGYLLN